VPVNVQGLRIERHLIDAEFYFLADVKDVTAGGARGMAQPISQVFQRALQQSKVVGDL
jgi:hypothetical protein